MLKLNVIYHAVFLSIFISSAVIALGSVLKWGPFRRVTPGYTKTLFSVLILEVVAAVLAGFTIVQGADIERYEFKFAYNDYLDDFKELASPEVQACIDEYEETQTFPDRSPCIKNGNKKSVCAYIRADSFINHNTSKGSGDMYLTSNGAPSRYEGLMGYRFPGEKELTLLKVSSADRSADERAKNLLYLEFDQQDSLAEINKGGSIDRELTRFCSKRVHQAYTIKFKSIEDGKAFKGDLVDKDITIGTAKLTLKTG